MNKIQTFEQFLTTQSAQLSAWALIINLVLAAVLAFILGRIYVKYGHSLSNRKMFAKNFVLMTMTTMLVITIVKSSLALSLGLVGALSIVRFRAAIKEPEELTYLFLAIGIGLGLGADQTVITLAAFAVIVAVLTLRNYRAKREEDQNLHLTVACHNSRKIPFSQITDTLKTLCSAVDLKRFDETDEQLEATFRVEFDDLEQLNKTKDELRRVDEHIRITFLDNTGLV